jgi:hypothetical protein
MFKVNHQKITLQVLGQIPIKMIEKFGKKFFLPLLVLRKEKYLAMRGWSNYPQGLWDASATPRLTIWGGLVTPNFLFVGNQTTPMALGVVRPSQVGHGVARVTFFLFLTFNWAIVTSVSFFKMY